MAARMSGISTHVLDTARGKPAADVPVRLEREEAADKWKVVGEGRTDANGRCAQLLSGGAAPAAGNYRLVFDTKAYFGTQKIEGLYPLVQVQFTVRAGEEHFHIPLLLSPNGYTTYRGS
jgi:5-hydroxyisourate hydrolase